MSYSSGEIHALQLDQRMHDDLYHPDISRLDLSRRIAHLTLHLSKYCGDLAVAMPAENSAAVHKALVDCAIISLSAATAVNVELGVQRSSDCDPVSHLGFLMRLVARVGRIAKAAEALDHVEDYPFRKVWEEEFSKIFHMSVSEIDERAARPGGAFDEMRSRLDFVKSKNSFGIPARTSL